MIKNRTPPVEDARAHRAAGWSTAVVLVIVAAISGARSVTLRAQKPPSGQRADAASTTARRLAAGGALYRKVGCYQCHVNEAQGGANGPRLGPDAIAYTRFAQYVRNPTGDMPPYTAKVLSDQELADIYAFVQARPRPPALNTIPQLEP